MAQHIKAPYNFVPFDKSKIFYPEWADEISQDRPFADGESGYIDLEIEAVSPIYIRNGHHLPEGISAQERNANPDYTDFFNIKKFRKQEDGSIKEEKCYAIPGTSLKGMFRNVLEAMSYGKMGFVNARSNTLTDKFVVRDLNNKKLYMSQFKLGSVYCGWLTRKKLDNTTGEDSVNDFTYKITYLGNPDKIKHQQIDAAYGSNLEGFFSKKIAKEVEYRYRTEKKREKTTFQEENNEQKTAEFKYLNFKVSFLDKKLVKYNVGKKGGISNDGKRQGYLVFTGQPNLSIPKEGKCNEFLFPKESEKPYDIEVPSERIAEFFHVYEKGNDDSCSKDWLFWKEKMEQGQQVPVFFVFSDDKKSIKSMGLSYLHKLVYGKTVGDLTIDVDNMYKPDLAECIFGFTEDYAASRLDTRLDKEKLFPSLKGRVQFCHAEQIGRQANEYSQRPSVEEVLSSPKATFYPNYIEQEASTSGYVSGDYLTFNDTDVKLSGRKRYPVSLVQKNNKPEKIKETSKDNEEVLTKFRPLPKGVKFKGKIFFHNLRPVELGALLSAITFHNDQGQNFFHSVGMAKPLGYGAIKVIGRLSKGLVYSPTEYMGLYEKYMNAHLVDRKGEAEETFWCESDSIKELFTMSAFQENKNEASLAYMKLDEHRRAKGNNEALARYSKFDGIVIRTPKSLIVHKVPSYSRVQGIIDNLYDKLGLEKDYSAKEKEKAKILVDDSIVLSTYLTPNDDYYGFVRSIKDYAIAKYQPSGLGGNDIWKNSSFYPFVTSQSDLSYLKEQIVLSLKDTKGQKLALWKKEFKQFLNKIISYRVYDEWVRDFQKYLK